MSAPDIENVPEVDLDELALDARAGVAADPQAGYPRPLAWRVARALVIKPWRAVALAAGLLAIVFASLGRAGILGELPKSRTTPNALAATGQSFWRLMTHPPTVGAAIAGVAVLAAALWWAHRAAIADTRHERLALARRAAEARLRTGFGAYLKQVKRSASAGTPPFLAIGDEPGRTQLGAPVLPLRLARANALGRPFPIGVADGARGSLRREADASGMELDPSDPRAHEVGGITEALANARTPAIALIGARGAGKSALLRQLARTLADADAHPAPSAPTDGRVPLYLDLGDALARNPRAGGFPRFERLIGDYVLAVPGIGHLDVSDRIRRALLVTGPSILLIDGLDDLADADRERALAELNRLAHDAARTSAVHNDPANTSAPRESDDAGAAPARSATAEVQIVVAARATTYRQGDLEPGLFDPWTVLPLVDADARERLVGRVAKAIGAEPPGSPADFLELLAAETATAGWASNPGALITAASGWARGAHAHPAKTPAGLCAYATRALLARGLAGWDVGEIAAAQRLVAAVALEYIWIGERPVTRDLIRRLIAARLTGVNAGDANAGEGDASEREPLLAPWSARGILPEDLVLQHSGLFFERGDGRFAVADPRVLASMAAETLAHALSARLPAPLVPETILGALESAGWLAEDRPSRALPSSALDSETGRDALDLAWSVRGAARWAEVLVRMVGIWFLSDEEATPADTPPRPRRTDLARAWVRALLDQPTDPGLLGLRLAARTVAALAPDDEDARALAREVAARLVGGHRAAIADDTADLGQSAPREALAQAISLAATGAGRVGVIDEIQRRLTHPDAATRAAAARAAGILGAVELIPELAPLLADDEARVRRVTALAIGDCGPEGALALPQLRALLADAHREVRLAAARAIGRLGSSAADALPGLVKAIQDPEAAPREAAARALAALGAWALPSLVDVAALLDDRREPVRVAALEALAGMGPGAARALPLVRPLLDDESWTVRRAAVEAAAAIGRDNPDILSNLRTRLTDPDADVRRATAWAVRWLRPDAALLPALRGRLSDPDYLVRQAAIRTIGALGGVGTAAHPGLVQRLTDSAPEVRAAAALALAESGAGGASVLADLNALLVDPDATVRGAAGEAIVRLLGADATEVLPDLQNALDISLPEVRLAAVAAAGALGANGASIVPAVVPYLSAADPALRQAVVATLGALGPASAEALPELRRLLADGDVLVREAAVRALGTVGAAGAEAVTDLRGLLGDGDAFVREAAARALGTLGPVAVEALPDLLARLADRRRAVRRAAAEAIAAIRAGEDGDAISTALAGSILTDDLTAPVAGPSAPTGTGQLYESAEPRIGSVVADLLSLMSDTDVSVRRAAGRVLRALGTTGAPALPDLRARLTAPPADARRVAAEAVGALGSAGAVALPELVALLADPDETVRRAAMAAIGRLGAEGEDVLVALPGLRASLEDPSPGVRQAAAAAIGTLGTMGAPACAELESLLADAAHEVRRAAATALGSMGAVAAPTAPALITALADPESDVTRAAASALAAVRPDALNALTEELRAAVIDGRARGVFTAFARRRELDLLQAMGPVAWVFSDTASAHLDDQNWSVRRGAAHALGAMGRVRDGALAALLRARHSDPVGPVRAEAGEALEDILARFPDLPA